MALDIRHKVVDFKFRHLTDRKLEIRIGLHSGITYVYMTEILFCIKIFFFIVIRHFTNVTTCIGYLNCRYYQLTK